MCAERKKVAPKPVIKAEPKKRVDAEKTEVKKQEKKVEPKKRVEQAKASKPSPKKRDEVVNETEKPKTKRSEDKYIRIALDASSDERKIFTDRVAKGELKLAYFAVENDKGYHYYLVIKK